VASSVASLGGLLHSKAFFGVKGERQHSKKERMGVPSFLIRITCPFSPTYGQNSLFEKRTQKEQIDYKLQKKWPLLSTFVFNGLDSVYGK
jgi:hypothetical protein